MKHAVALLTYAPSGTGCSQRLPRAVWSILRSGYRGEVIIVDDGSTDPRQHRWLRSFEGGQISVVRRPKNGGICRAKNTCIRSLMERGVDVGFILEDDILLAENWWEPYLEAHAKTTIQHFSWYHRDSLKSQVIIDGHPVVKCGGLNGLLLTFTPDVIESVGGFAIMPSVYGHTHSNWTNRIVHAGLSPFWADVEGSCQLVQHGQMGNEAFITTPEKKRLSKKNSKVRPTDQIYWELTE